MLSRGGDIPPSKESREHAVWMQNGLVTVTGGKLTIYRLMAHQALRAVRSRLPDRPRFDRRLPAFQAVDHIPAPVGVEPLGSKRGGVA